MLKIVIIEDEKKARDSLRKMIEMYADNVEQMAEAENVQTGTEAIRRHNPNIVFLDIHMPDGSGFDVLKQIDKVDFKIIFVTAFEEYAIKAFKFSALDYLLKPIDPDELIKALEIAEQSIEKENAALKMEAFMTNINNMKNGVKKIVLKTAESIHLVQVDDIVRLESTGNYSRFHFTSRKPLLVSKTLKEFDEMLNPYGFMRVHQSHLINLDHILQYEKSDGGSIILSDNQPVPVSVRKKDVLLDYFQNM